MINQKYVIITRSAKESRDFAEELKTIGLKTFCCPSIKFAKNLSIEEINKFLSDISSYDWIIFTSSNGVGFFMDAFCEIEKNISSLKNIKIAAVGEKTAEKLKKYGLSVFFVPTIFTIDNLTKEMPDIRGANILIPRSNIGNPELKNQLEIKGAIVIDMPVYKTMGMKANMIKLRKIMQAKEIFCLTFTSPSAIGGFMQNLQDTKEKEYILSLPICSIGPITTKKAKEYGFTNIHTSKIHTTEGMTMMLKENIISMNL